MAESIVARRLVFHVGGYEPVPPEAMYRRFTRELRRFESTWSATGSVSEPELGPDKIAWQVAASGPNWRVDTDFRLVRWDDIIEAGRQQPGWRRFPRGLLAFADFIAAGALWGYCRRNWRYAGFFLYPFVLFAAFAAVAAVAGLIVAKTAGSALAGALVGALAFVLFLRWPGQRFYLPLLFDDWIFARTYVRQDEAALPDRLERLARELVAEARERKPDEILIVGHSLGAVLAIDLLDRALKLDPALAEGGARLALITVGSSVLKIGLHRGAAPFHAAVERVASRPGVFWVDYHALTDVMNFYKIDPVAAMGLTGARGPLLRAVRIRRTLDPARYRRIRRSFFRVHRQFVSGNDQRALYDYFMLVCGPLFAESQAREREGAVPAFGPDGTLLAGAPEQEIAPQAATAERR